MKVLYVNHTGHVSGGERSLLDLMAGLPSGVEPVVACPPGALADALAQRGLKAHRIPETDGSLKLHPWHTSRSLLELGGAALAVRNVAIRERAELIHANSIRAGLLAAACARAGGPPAVTHVRDCLPSTGAARATQRLIAANTAVIANSRHTAGCFMRTGGGKGRALRVVHSPVDLEHFDPAAIDRASARDALGVRSSGPVLGVIGQLTPWKGQDDAVRMLAKLRGAHPDASLLLVGSTKFVSAATRFDNRAFARRLETLIGSLGLERHVTFLGERDDVPRLLAAMDLLLVPSWEEPFGRVVLEGMAMGVPVLATNVGGPAEVIADGEEGRLLPPRRPDLWAAEADRLLSDPGLRAAMGERGRLKVRARHRLERHVEGVLAVYGEVLGPGWKTVANGWHGRRGGPIRLVRRLLSRDTPHSPRPG